MEKQRSPKRMSSALREAQSRLNSAVIRGDDPLWIEVLIGARDAIAKADNWEEQL